MKRPLESAAPSGTPSQQGNSRLHSEGAADSNAPSAERGNSMYAAECWTCATRIRCDGVQRVRPKPLKFSSYGRMAETREALCRAAGHDVRETK